jgi:DNA repair exonuclease SbcCD ATPase subunit
LEEKAALVTGIEKSHESVEQSQAATKDNQQHDGDIRIAQCNKVIEQPAKVNEQAISTDDSLCTENEETTPDTKEGEVKTSAHTYPPAGASPPDTPPASEQNQRSNDRTIEEEAKQELNGSKSSQDTPQVWQERTNNLLTTNSKRISEINHSMAERRGESTHQFQELLSRAQLRIQALTEQRRLKEEEAVALCEENYSRAEELREQIEEEKMILSTSHPVVDDLLQVLPSIEDKFTEALQKELTDRTAVMEGVTQYREELANVMATLEGKHQDFMDLENENLKKFKEKVKEQEKEVAKQSKEVMMAEEELKEMIQDKCQEFQTKKDELTAEMETVEEEIAELERRLKALREQRTALSIEIKKQERGISEAQRSFAKDQRKMDEQKNDVAKQQQQLEMEQSTLERMEKEMEVSTETYSRSAKEFSVVMETLVSQVNMHKSRLDSVAMEIEHISSFKDNFLPSFSPSEELQRLLEDEASKTSLVQELADEVVKGQAKLTETRGQLSDVRTSRPQLEDAKKAAITARNYKEAGRLNEELKALLAKETDLAKDIDSLLSELEETSGKLDTVQEELAVTIEARSEAEKSEESSRLQTLSECCQKIEQTMSELVWFCVAYDVSHDFLYVSHDLSCDV